MNAKASSIFIAILLLFLANTLSFAQNRTAFPEIRTIYESPTSQTAAYMKFQNGQGPALLEMGNWLQKKALLPENCQLEITRQHEDINTELHTRHSLKYRDLPVEFAEVITHGRNQVSGWNGTLPKNFTGEKAVLNRVAARHLALGPDPQNTTFMWELPLSEQRDRPDGKSWFPEGQLCYAPDFNGAHKATWRLAYRFEIVAADLSMWDAVYIDAVDGHELLRNSMRHTLSTPGTALTRFSGLRNIIADSAAQDTFILLDSIRQIQTLNHNQATNVNAITNFFDFDNFWNNANATLDEVAGDVHWGLETTYDYLNIEHGRNGWDDNGAPTLGYVHYGMNLGNAAWFPFGYAAFGDGGNGMDPYTTLDIVAHEMGHGVVQQAANLLNMDEHGALAESFCDIFGAAVEQFADSALSDWEVGGGRTAGAIRDMEDPKSKNHPDTYLGTNWWTAAGDNGGIHINCGVQNRWFSLLIDGGSGMNDNGDNYSVSALGWDTTMAIVYHALTVYHTSLSEYHDARYYAILSAEDLYGTCSNATVQVTNAWHAVGLGAAFGINPQAAFITPDTIFCIIPVDVPFFNQSTSGVSYEWDFGDNTTSIAENPVHQYTANGTYTVRLIAKGCPATSDTILRTAYITIDSDPNTYCAMTMPPATDQITIHDCNGRLRDAGGVDNYPDNTAAQITIAPGGNSTVTLNFSQFEYAGAGDFVRIFDGPTTTSPLIGVYGGSSLPNGGTISSTGNAITIEERSNGSNNAPGFELEWTCNTVNVEAGLDPGALDVYPQPADAAFQVAYRPQGDGEITFRLVDATGKLVFARTEMGATQIQFPVTTESIAAGIYFLQVVEGGRRLNRKVTVR
ncbi:MAG: M4 family metallopeptidase [Bacteroidota bacterium]